MLLKETLESFSIKIEAVKKTRHEGSLKEERESHIRAIAELKEKEYILGQEKEFEERTKKLEVFYEENITPFLKIVNETYLNKGGKTSIIYSKDFNFDKTKRLYDTPKVGYCFAWDESSERGKNVVFSISEKEVDIFSGVDNNSFKETTKHDFRTKILIKDKNFYQLIEDSLFKLIVKEPNLSSWSTEHEGPETWGPETGY